MSVPIGYLTSVPEFNVGTYWYNSVAQVPKISGTNRTVIKNQSRRYRYGLPVLKDSGADPLLHHSVGQTIKAFNLFFSINILVYFFRLYKDTVLQKKKSY